MSALSQKQNEEQVDVLSTVQWLEDRVKQMKLSDDLKESILSKLEWLTTKFRSIVGGGAADFVNDQLRKICDLVDVIAPNASTPLLVGTNETGLTQEFENGDVDGVGDMQNRYESISEHGDPLRTIDASYEDGRRPAPEHPYPEHNRPYEHEHGLENRQELEGRSRMVPRPQPRREGRFMRSPNEDKHSLASDWMNQDFTPAPMTFRPHGAPSRPGPPDESESLSAPGPYDAQPHTVGKYHRPPPQYDYRALVPLQPDDHPDVHLNIPNLSVALIDFEIDEIQARVALEASVKDAVHIFAGVDARIGRVKLTIEDVQATVQLTARLDNVRKILERGLDSVDGIAQPTISKLLGIVR